MEGFRWFFYAYYTNGNSDRGYNTRLPTDVINNYGWKVGDKEFYGTIQSNTITGKAQLLFPIDTKNICPEQYIQWGNITLSLSQDANTLNGELYGWQLHNPGCSLTYDYQLSVSYTREQPISTACPTVTINPDLSIHIPQATYQPLTGNPVKLWADLQPVPAAGGLQWRLGNFAVTP